MKSSIKIIITFLFLGTSLLSYAQQRGRMMYNRPDGKEGLQMFETLKDDTLTYEGVRIAVGADFAIQFQSLSQSNSDDSLVSLGNDFNLPTANLDIDAQLLDGVSLHLRTYLSSRNHPEAWVKGGHIQIDRLDFIHEQFLDELMKFITIRGGLDEFNYGDAHFHRTDNAQAIYNPFVGNYIMDAFSTEVFGEITVYAGGFLGVVGLTNGKLNQSVIVHDNSDNQPSFYGKLGFDKEIQEDLRLRLTGSWYTNQGTTTGTWLYGGDRAGARYYSVLRTLQENANGIGTNFEGRFNPRFRRLTALQVNPFIKYKGLEFFGIYELASNHAEAGGGAFTQWAGELLFRFGGDDQFYLGGRYNLVTGEMEEGAPNREISRFNLGGGWFLSDNILSKIEYVNQQYEEEGWNNTKYSGAEFNGIVIEATVSF